MTDAKEDSTTLWMKDDLYSLSRDDIDCRRCDSSDLDVDQDVNDNDMLRCNDCGRANYFVISELHEDQKISANIKGIYEAVISKSCSDCGRNLEYSGRSAWERFSNRNQWSCPNGCIRNMEFRDGKEFTLKHGKTSVSLYQIIPTRRIVSNGVKQ